MPTGRGEHPDDDPDGPSSSGSTHRRAPSGAANELFKAIGGRVRARRLDQHLTLDQLSSMSGVSRRMITMLEGGETNTSLGTLDKLARALGLDFATLAAVRPMPALIPETTRSVQPVWEDGKGSSARLLDSRSNARVVEIWHWELVAGARYESEADPPGTEEFLVVQTGKLVAEVGGDRFALEGGQHLRLPTDAPYAYVNPGRGTVRFVRVVVIP